jgi:hypothetical protein
MRQPINVMKSLLSAQPSEAQVKQLTASTNSQRIEKMRVSSPVSGIAMTSAIRYAV